MNFDAFQTEREILERADGVLAGGNEADFRLEYEKLRNAYAKSLKSLRRLLRLCDGNEGRLKKANVRIQQQQEELEEANKKLEEQNSILRESIRLREEVERITQHDIKTPLTALLSVPNLMIQEGGLSDSQIELLRMCEESAYRILEMVNSSIDLYKMETGTYQLSPIPVDLLKLLNQIHGETREIIGSKGLLHEIWLGGSPARSGDTFMVAGEEMLCYSMLANLIKNAVEASPGGGSIRVELDDSQDPIVSIHNDGAVPEDMRERFFDKYATSGKEGGTGLGTYSASLIAKTLGGEISFESSEEKGTTLFIKLPRGAKAPECPSGASASEPAPGAKKASSPSGNRVGILVVDDTRNMRRVIMGMLRQMGFDSVMEAEDGASAVRVLESEKVDLVLSDWNMKNMTGIQLLSYVRSKRGLRDIPFIMITGEAKQENILEATRQKVSDYVVKPFSADTLRKKLGKFIR